MSFENRHDCFIGVLLCGAVGGALGFVNKGKLFEDIKKEETDFTWTRFHYMYGSNIELMIILGRYIMCLNKHTPKEIQNILTPESKQGVCRETVNGVHMLYKNAIKNSKKVYNPETLEILKNWEPTSSVGTLNNCDAAIRVSPLALTFLKTDNLLYNEIVSFVYCTHGASKDSIDIAFVHVKLLHSLLFRKRTTAEEIYPYTLYLAQLCKNKQLYISIMALNPNNKQSFVSNQWNITKSLYGFEFFHQTPIECYVCALTCFLYNFNNPTKAMLSAMKVGGDTESITKLTGDMIGAVHGFKWLPLEWNNIENKELLSNVATGLYCCFPKDKHGWVFEHSENIAPQP